MRHKVNPSLPAHLFQHHLRVELSRSPDEDYAAWLEQSHQLDEPWPTVQYLVGCRRPVWTCALIARATSNKIADEYALSRCSRSSQDCVEQFSGASDERFPECIFRSPRTFSDEEDFGI